VDRTTNKTQEHKRPTKHTTTTTKKTTTTTGEENKEVGETEQHTKGTPERNQNNEIGRNNNNSNNSNNNNGNNSDKNNNNNNNKNTNRDERDKSNNKEGGNKSRVNIMEPGDMATYTFTVAWRSEHKKGLDGKIIIKNLMREMVHRTPTIVFHPTNSATSPVPRDINNTNNDFPKTSASYDDFFDQMRNRDNTNQRTFMKVTMPHDEKELQKKLSNYLFHNKI
jgi:hypothetical protein